MELLYKLENEMIDDCLKNNKQVIEDVLYRKINGPEEKKLEIFKEIFKLTLINELEKIDVFEEFEEFDKYKSTCTFSSDLYIPEIFNIIEDYRRIFQEFKPLDFLDYENEIDKICSYVEICQKYKKYITYYPSFDQLKYKYNKNLYKFMKNYENEIKNMCKDYLCQDLITIVLDYI